MFHKKKCSDFCVSWGLACLILNCISPTLNITRLFFFLFSFFFSRDDIPKNGILEYCWDEDRSREGSAGASVCGVVPSVAKLLLINIPFKQFPFMAWISWTLPRFPGKEQHWKGFLSCCPWWPVPAMLLSYHWPSTDGSGSTRVEGS